MIPERSVHTGGADQIQLYTEQDHQHEQEGYDLGYAPHSPSNR